MKDPDRKPPLALDVALGLGLFLIWRISFGALGAAYDSDTAIFGGMALRPLERWGLYFWGQDRLGAVVPLLSMPFVRLGADAASTAQAVAMACAAIGLTSMLRLLRGLPGKLLFVAFFAFPSANLALNFCRPHSIHGLLLFLGPELLIVHRLAARRSAALAALAGLLAGLSLWAGEPAIFAFVPQAALLLRVRPTRGRGTFALFGWMLVGAVPALCFLAYAKRNAIAVPDYLLAIPFGLGLRNLLQLERQFRALAPFPGAGGSYAVVLALLLAGLAALRRGSLEVDRAIALVGPVPFLAVAGACCSSWYQINDRDPRYLVLPMFFAALGVALALDSLSERGGILGTALAVAGSVALSVTVALVNPRGNRRHVSDGPRLRLVAQTLETAGCQGVLGDFWHSYAFFTLTNGAVNASPRESGGVRSREMAEAAVSGDVVCVVPWPELGTTCPSRLTQFGSKLSLERRGEVAAGGETLTVCWYQQVSPSAPFPVRGEQQDVLDAGQPEQEHQKSVEPERDTR